MTHEKITSRYQYVQRKGNYNHYTVCGLMTKCNAVTQQGVYVRVPAVDSTSFYVNRSDAVCDSYLPCPDGHYR